LRITGTPDTTAVVEFVSSLADSIVPATETGSETMSTP
jgi:hypothetical protein